MPKESKQNITPRDALRKNVLARYNAKRALIGEPPTNRLSRQVDALIDALTDDVLRREALQDSFVIQVRKEVS